jgi:hypothetical protein
MARPQFSAGEFADIDRQSGEIISLSTNISGIQKHLAVNSGHYDEKVCRCLYNGPADLLQTVPQSAGNADLAMRFASPASKSLQCIDVQR